MSKTAKVLIRLIVVATIAVDGVAAYHYSGSTDGQVGALLVILLVYGLLASALVWLLDRAFRRLHRRRLTDDVDGG